MRIAIAGFGLEGRVNYNYFKNLYPSAAITIFDEGTELENLPEGADVVLGKDAFNGLNDFDLVVRTPSLSPHKIITQGKIWSSTNEFFVRCQAKIIGVTGTKGKGTTSSLVASVLEAAGYKVHLLGNIGVPALEMLGEISADDIVVYELSSFQLWDFRYSPHIAIVLMIEPDHLDIHKNMDDYLQAKSQIASHQKPMDIVVYHPTNALSEQVASKSAGRKLRYDSADDGAVYVDGGKFCIQDREICSVEALSLVGNHNIQNATAALTAIYALDPNISNSAVEQGLKNFDGLEHRLKYVDTKNGVDYYDDSIATTPGSVIAAVEAFDAPKVLIMGGLDKSADYTEMVGIVTKPSSKVRAVVLIGANAEALADLFGKNNPELIVDIQGKRPMSEIVRAAASHAAEGDVVLLSPAAASFDMFKSYQDRGGQFIESVKSL